MLYVNKIDSARFYKNINLSFYFYQIQTLSKANISDLKEYTQKKAKDYLKKYGSKGKYYAEVVELMGH